MTEKVIPLGVIGKTGTVKVYNQAYVDKLEKQIDKMKQCLRGVVYMATSGLQTKNELAFARLIAEAEALCKE